MPEGQFSFYRAKDKTMHNLSQIQLLNVNAVLQKVMSENLNLKTVQLI